MSTGTGEVTEVTTAEGVLYRVREDGTVLDAVAEVAAEGAETVTPEQAQQVAEAFVRTNVAEFDGRWRLTASHVVSHFDDDRLWGATWHLSGGTGQADRAVTVEVDRRTRVVTYFADLRTSTLPGVSRTSEQQAIDTALTVADGPGRVSAELVRWGVPRWIVTIDRGLEGRAGFETPDIEQVVVDARNGSVIATTTT